MLLAFSYKWIKSYLVWLYLMFYEICGTGGGGLTFWCCYWLKMKCVSNMITYKLWTSTKSRIYSERQSSKSQALFYIHVGGRKLIKRQNLGLLECWKFYTTLKGLPSILLTPKNPQSMVSFFDPSNKSLYAVR